MRTIRELVNPEKKVYIFLRTKELQDRFLCDAEREGITFGDGVKPTERKADDIMALQPDGTICFLGFAGRMSYHYFYKNKRKGCAILRSANEEKGYKDIEVYDLQIQGIAQHMQMRSRKITRIYPVTYSRLRPTISSTPVPLHRVCLYF